jgi:hypothetical protein
VLDKHAPPRTVTLKGQNLKPWYGDEIHEARKKRRQLERKSKKTGLEIHQQMFREQSRTVVTMINNSKSAYYSGKLLAADCKETFCLINGLLSYNLGSPLPPSMSDQVLADDFVYFYQTKIQKLSQQLASSTVEYTQSTSSCDEAPQLNVLTCSVKMT